MIQSSYSHPYVVYNQYDLYYSVKNVLVALTMNVDWSFI